MALDSHGCAWGVYMHGDGQGRHHHGAHHAHRAEAAVHDVLAERMGEVARHNDTLQANEKAASAELETKLRGAAVARCPP